MGKPNLFSFKPRKISYVHLDMARGLASLAVVFGHLRNIFFQDYQTVSQSLLGPFVKTVYFLSGFGHQAVMIFFVLSGFFITRSIMNAHQKGCWSWGWYLSQRLTRLWLVLIPALIMTAVWDGFGIRFNPGALQYLGTAESNVTNYLVSGRLNINYFIGNIFFTQTILCPTFGSNSPIWSLANEFWYYVLFPCFWVSLRSSTRFIARCILSSIAALICFFIGTPILFGFSIWLMGSLCYFVTKTKWGHKIFAPKAVRLLTSSIFLIVLAGTRFHLSSFFGSDFAIGIAFSLFMCSICFSHPKIESIYANTAQKLSSISYSLYVTHLPPIVFAAAFLVRTTRWDMNFKNSVFLMFLIIAILGYVLLMYTLFESKTELVREKITRIRLVILSQFTKKHLK